MTEAFAYTVPGRPVSWSRPNVVRGRPVTDAKQKPAKAAHALCAARALVVATRGAAGAPRASWSLRGAFAVEVRGYYASAVVADADRLASLALDALQGVAYETDRQVRRVVSEVHADGTAERVEVTVTRMTADTVRSSARSARAATKRHAMIAEAEEAFDRGDIDEAARIRTAATKQPRARRKAGA